MGVQGDTVVQAATFAEIRSRLDQIAEQVAGDDMSLDAALDLYDEAVKLEMKATELLQAIDVSEVPGRAAETAGETADGDA